MALLASVMHVYPRVAALHEHTPSLTLLSSVQLLSLLLPCVLWAPVGERVTEVCCTSPVLMFVRICVCVLESPSVL